MSLLSPRLQLKVAQKQILTPGLVQMVTVLQLNRLELKEMLNQEMVKNPVLEEALDDGEEISAEELQPLLEAERVQNPSDQTILEAAMVEGNQLDGVSSEITLNRDLFTEPILDGATAGVDAAAADAVLDAAAEAPEAPATADPFDEIDFGSFFDDYLDPGYKSPASESVEKPSFETFLSAPVTLGDHLRTQLSVSLVSDEIRNAAESIIGNLDDEGYVAASLEEIAAAGEHTMEQVEEALRVVQSLDPAGVGARSPRECLLLQIESMNG